MTELAPEDSYIIYDDEQIWESVYSDGQRANFYFCVISDFDEDYSIYIKNISGDKEYKIATYGYIMGLFEVSHLSRTVQDFIFQSDK